MRNKKGKRALLTVLCVMLLMCGVGCAEQPLEESSLPAAETTTQTVTTTTAPMEEDAFCFRATVIEVGEEYLLVQADEGGSVVGEVYVILQQTVSVTAGDRVVVRHTGQMMPSLPPRIVATEIERIE